MSISSTFYVRIFRTNVVLAAFFLVTCKLCVWRSYEKRTRIKLMKLTAGVGKVPVVASCPSRLVVFVYLVAQFDVRISWDILKTQKQVWNILFDPKIFGDIPGYPKSGDTTSEKIGDIPGYPDLWDIPADNSTFWDISTHPDLTRLIPYSGLSHWVRFL